MKKEDTKQKILDKALTLFAERGYESVSMDEIAKAVQIKAPSLYNHFSGKQAIFDAIFSLVSEQYEQDTDKFNIHVQDSSIDMSDFVTISEDMLFEKAKTIFEYSLHSEQISKFRKMMTIEQFRSSEIAELYTNRYVTRVINYHANIFNNLLEIKKINNIDPKTLAFAYVSPILVLIGICDRQPEKEKECLDRLEKHVRLFYQIFNNLGGKKQ